MSNHLARGKKMRDNGSRSALLRLKGEIDAAISEGDCLEAMLRLAEADGQVDQAAYALGTQACDNLEPGINAFSHELSRYVQGLGAGKSMLLHPED